MERATDPDTERRRARGARRDLSEPLLPQRPALSQQRHPAMALQAQRSFSYPFSQHEVLADATAQAHARGREGAFEALMLAAHRLNPSELVEHARAVDAVRAGLYKRNRPGELVIPQEGPSWRQVAALIATFCPCVICTFWTFGAF